MGTRIWNSAIVALLLVFGAAGMAQAKPKVVPVGVDH